MRDRLDRRIRSLVVELLDDPPAPPPFPDPDMVVVTGDHPSRREPMTKTDTRPETKPARSAWRRGPRAAVAAFVAIIAVALVAVALSRESAEPPPVAESDTTVPPVAEEPLDATALVGRTADVVDGRGSVPDRIEFRDDGTFVVVDDITMDTGSYVVTEGTISFQSDPTDDVEWVRELSMPNNPRPLSPCEGQVGEYSVTFVSSDRFTLDVVWDECANRVKVANGLELQLRP